MADSRIISRLRKLLALARSGNSHEASSAREKAERLMDKHGLAEADVYEVGPDEEVKVSLGSKGFERPWKFRLATLAARCYGCEALGLRVGERRKVRLVGRKAGVDEAVKLFNELDAELLVMARAEMAVVVPRFKRILPFVSRWRLERYLDSFRNGAVACYASQLLREEARRRAAEAFQAGMGAPSPVVPEGALVRAEKKADSAVVRERLVASGARQTDFEEEDEDFDELDELAFASGFRQALHSQVLRPAEEVAETQKERSQS